MNNHRILNDAELDLVSGGDHIQGNDGGDHSGRGDGGGAWRGFIGGVIAIAGDGVGAVVAAGGAVVKGLT